MNVWWGSGNVASDGTAGGLFVSGMLNTSPTTFAITRFNSADATDAAFATGGTLSIVSSDYSLGSGTAMISLVAGKIYLVVTGNQPKAMKLDINGNVDISYHSSGVYSFTEIDSATLSSFNMTGLGSKLYMSATSSRFSSVPSLIQVPLE